MFQKRYADESLFWADKLMDLANLASIVLIFSQLVNPKINWYAFLSGVIIYSLVMLFVLKIFDEL